MKPKRNRKLTDITVRMVFKSIKPAPLPNVVWKPKDKLFTGETLVKNWIQEL